MNKKKIKIFTIWKNEMIIMMPKTIDSNKVQSDKYDDIMLLKSTQNQV